MMRCRLTRIRKPAAWLFWLSPLHWLQKSSQGSAITCKLAASYRKDFDQR